MGDNDALGYGDAVKAFQGFRNTFSKKDTPLSYIGNIQSLWRYPVKSMRGERVSQVFLGFSGVYGDRVFAFRNSSGRKGFPYLSATAQERMLRYQPKFRAPEKTLQPPNLAEAMQISPGVTPANANPNDLALDIFDAFGRNQITG